MARKQGGIKGTAPSPIQMQTLTDWCGFTKGDPCNIRGRRGVFTFQYHTTTKAGNTWVTLYRPDYGFVAVHEDQIRHNKKAGKRK